MDFIDSESIMAFCRGCHNLQIKYSHQSGRQYEFCKSYQTPCFKCLDECKNTLILFERDKENAKRQRKITDYIRGE